MDNSLEKELKFDKYRISIGLIPIEQYSYYSFSYVIADDNYDWILEKTNQQCFIPVFKPLQDSIEQFDLLKTIK